MGVREAVHGTSADFGVRMVLIVHRYDTFSCVNTLEHLLQRVSLVGSGLG